MTTGLPQIQAVHTAVRVLSAHEAELKMSPVLRQLHPVWQYVIDNSMPPTVVPSAFPLCYHCASAG